MTKRLAFLISRNNLALSMFGKNYDELDVDEKCSLDEMLKEVPELENE